MSFIRSAGFAAAFAFAAAIGAAAFSSNAQAAEVDKKTQRMWKAKCASCHGAAGKGDTEQGKKMAIRDMTSAAVQKEMTDDSIKKALKEGVKTDKGEMEAFAELTPEQVDGLLTYIRSLKK